MSTDSLFAKLPAISSLICEEPLKDLPHDLAAQIARQVVEDARLYLKSGGTELPNWFEEIHAKIQHLKNPRLRKVINATGIVVHTNLGRAPLLKEAADNLHEIATSYANLEIDLDTGQRGGRLNGVADRICNLTGAQACIVVNNNAAATLLAVSALAQNREIVVSRGELVEIGGSYRIPDVITTGGAHMVEVGTTNRTRTSDYHAALSENTGAFLRVHPSNFRVVGFTQRPERRELADLAHEHGIPLIDDLGSGVLDRSPKIPYAQNLYKEESVAFALNEGADVVCFSGDKLLGGPQAGFIVGRQEYIELCRKHPLYRALRCSKLIYAALEPILIRYEEHRASEIPVWLMLERTEQECFEAAHRIRDILHQRCPSLTLDVCSTQNYSGGGALPQQGLASAAVQIKTAKAEDFSRELRQGTPSVAVRIQNSSLLVEPRTLLDGEEQVLIERIVQVVKLLGL